MLYANFTALPELLPTEGSRRGDVSHLAKAVTRNLFGVFFFHHFRLFALFF